LRLHAVSFKDRFFARVQLDAIDEARLDAVYELNDLLILLFVVHANGCEIVRELIAQETLYEIEVFVRHRWRFLLLGGAAYVFPCADEITRVVAQVLFADADACGADDEAARRHFLSLAYVFDELAQALPLTVRLDLARDADVFDGRHIDKDATGQSDVRSDARAFGRNRLFGDLHEYLLPLAQEVCDHRRAAITAASAPCVPSSAPFSPGLGRRLRRRPPRRANSPRVGETFTLASASANDSSALAPPSVALVAFVSSVAALPRFVARPLPAVPFDADFLLAFLL